MLVLAALILPLFSEVAPLKAQSSSVLWIAAVENEHLIPIAALVDGRWWSLDVGDDQRRALTTAAVGRLPSEWRVHFFNGAVTTVRVSANEWSVGAYGYPTPLETEPPLPKPGGGEEAFLQRGIAISGDATIKLFQEMDEHAVPDFGPVLARRAVDVARAAVKRTIAAGGEGAELWAAVNDKAIASAALNIESRYVAHRRDGSRVYFVEANKTPRDCEVHVRASIIQDLTGRLTVVSTYGQTFCDNAISLRPIAVVERNGASCWLTAVEYEDGTAHQFTAATDHKTAPAGVSCRIQ